MRKTGKTTRLIDEAIQTLFTEGVILIPTSLNNPINNLEGRRGVKIFIDDGGTNKAISLFKRRVLERLHYEHNLSQKNGLFINKSGLIELIKII